VPRGCTVLARGATEAGAERSQGVLLDGEQALRLGRQLASDAREALEWGVDLLSPLSMPGTPRAGHTAGVPGAGPMPGVLEAGYTPGIAGVRHRPGVPGVGDLPSARGLDINAPPPDSPPLAAEPLPAGAESAAPGPGAHAGGPRGVPRQHAEVAWGRGGEEDGVDWEAVRSASLAEVADVIKERGQHFVLAGRTPGTPLRASLFLQKIVK